MPIKFCSSERTMQRRRTILLTLTVALSYVALPSFGQEQRTAPVPDIVQGLWAVRAQCSDVTKQLVIKSNTIQFGKESPVKVFFAPNDSPSGNGAIHWAEEGFVSNLEYAKSDDSVLFNEEGYGMGKKPNVYKRCGSASQSAQLRCGWYMNPTPGDVYLVDREGTWWITSQSQAKGPNAAGSETMVPRFEKSEFIETQPGTGRGYGCACARVETNVQQHRVTSIITAKALPLARCKTDKSLPAPY